MQKMWRDMQKILAMGLLAILSVFSMTAHADLVINVTQGTDKPFPVAIVPFGGEPTLTNLPDGLSGVISNDLTLSGKFSVLPKSNMPARPGTAAAVNWQQWNPTNVQYLVVGSVQRDTSAYTVTVSVVSPLSAQPLLAKQYSHIPANQLRALAHFISDKVYQAITGVRGAASTRLAYVTVLNQGTRNVKYQLIVADSDGYNPQVLLQQPGNPIASPTWSPDGKQLAYVSYLHNRMIIYAITLATGARRVIASFTGMNSAPAWSPDGKSMAMALSQGNGSETNIYIMNLKTKALKKYTFEATNTSPSWSADGKTIIFNSDRGGQPQIYQLDLASGKVTRLSFDGLKNYDPIYTPDGNQIIMMHQDSGSSPIQLAVLDLRTGSTNVITTGNLDKSPSIAPNGQMIIYANYDRPYGVLAEVSLNGKIHLQLPTTQGSVQSPAWSPYLN